MSTKKTLAEKATKVINENKLQELISKKTSETMASIQNEAKEVKPKKEAKKVEPKPLLPCPKTIKVIEKAPTVKAEAKVTKETKKVVDKINKTTLVEAVVSNREVKYVYPEDCTDTLSRKSWRQKVRNKLHALEMSMYRIKDQNSKEYKKAQKEYDDFYKTVCKPNVAV